MDSGMECQNGSLRDTKKRPLKMEPEKDPTDDKKEAILIDLAA
jgi:hypothetical protein